MLKITVNDSSVFEVAINKEITLINGEAVDADIRKIDPDTYHVLWNNRSFRAEVVDFNAAEKACTLNINGHLYAMDIKDRYSELLAQLGLDKVNSQKMTALKAPMPGLVLHIFVKEGDEVKKDDSLVTLEAMKMENILKCPADGIVKSIKVILGDKVEKNQVLIGFG